MGKQRVLIITGDPIGTSMAGPAIRAWHMAHAVSEQQHEVRLLSFTGIEPLSAPFELTYVAFGDNANFAEHEKWADVIIFQGHALLVFEQLRKSKKIFVVDIYDPMHLEQLEQAKDLPLDKWVERVSAETEVLNDQLLRGDFFICASDRQRYFWLGQLAALGRINPYVYQRDSTLNSFISIVPFGLAETEPEHLKDVLRGVIPNIYAEDKVILWSGGLYDWFDPQTLIQAVGILSKKYKSVKLFFQGTKHPNPHVLEMDIVKASKKLASDLGILNTNVFFNDSWVPYAQRANYLLEANVGVSTHHLHAETAFSFRTRILDYLWARLPMVVTRGDYFSELVEKEELGFVVEDNDVNGLVRALEEILFNEALNAKFQSNINEVRERFYWNHIFTPLLQFLEDSRHAPDIENWLKTDTDFQYQGKKFKSPGKLKLIASAVLSTYKSDGLSGLFHKLNLRIRRKI